MKALEILKQGLAILELSREFDNSLNLISDIFKYRIAIKELEDLIKKEDIDPKELGTRPYSEEEKKMQDKWLKKNKVLFVEGVVAKRIKVKGV